jgi:hypothetical protein
MALRATTGTPERLMRAEGAWKLQLERLVYDGPWLLHPRRLEVLGEEAILQQLRDLKGCEPLAKDAQRLFTAPASTVGSYVARENRWIVEINPQAAPKPASAAQPDAAVANEQIEHLHKRIGALEGSIRALQKLVEEALKQSAKAAAAAQQSASRPQAQPQSADSTQGHKAAAGSAATARTEQRSDAVAEADSPRPQAAPAQPSAPAPLTLPSQGALSDLVRSLAGANAEFTLASAPVDWSAAASAHGAKIYTNDGREVGLLLFDLEGALRFAGALLMESDEAVANLLESGAMNADMLDAASEVANTFMSVFNKTSGNPHVRTEKLSPLDAAWFARIAQGRKREDYHYNRGGHVALIAL